MTNNRPGIAERLGQEVRSKGVLGAGRSAAEYLTWRLRGSPSYPGIDHVRERYLELLKSCLLDDIYGSTVSEKAPDPERAGAPATKDEVLYGTIWPGRAHTMVGRKRLDNIQHCVETVIRDGVPGDLIETGVWRGGATIFMRAVLDAYGDNDRVVYVADSFEGLPPPEEDRYPADAGDILHEFDALAIGVDEVQNNFARYGLLDDRVRFVKGFFEDSLRDIDIEQLSLLRLDGDMYSSTIQVLQYLYDRVSPGGFIIIDDYALEGCKVAVEEFRDERSIDDPMTEIDWTGRFWRKS